MTHDFKQTDGDHDSTSIPNSDLGPMMLDRMVDGELTSDEQRTVLLRCEEQGRWRELALAYVESQVLGGTLGDSSFLLREDQKPKRSDVPVVRESSTEIETRTPSVKSENWNLMSLAAAVLLSLGLGYGLVGGGKAMVTRPQFRSLRMMERRQIRPHLQ